MAGNDTAALIVSLEAKLDKFIKAMDESVKVADRSAREIEGRFDKLNGVINDKFQALASNASGQLGTIGLALRTLGPAGIAAAVTIGSMVLALNAAGEAAQQLAEKAKGLRDLAASTGLSTLELQALGKAASRVGVSTDELEGFITRFTVKIDELQKGGGDLRKELLGIDAGLVSQLEKATSTAEALTILSKAYTNLDSTFKRNALSRAAGAGRQGIGAASRLLSAGIDVGAEAEALRQTGKALDENLIQKLPQLSLEIEKMSKKAKENFTSIFAEDVLTAQRDFAKGFLAISELAKQFSTSDEFKGMVQGFKIFTGAITAPVRAVQSLVAKPPAAVTSQPASTPESLGTPAVRENADELQKLFTKREKLIDQLALATAAAKGEQNAHAVEAERLSGELDKVNAQYEKRADLVQKVTRITVTPTDDPKRRLQQEVADLQAVINAQGENAKSTDVLTLRRKEAQLAELENQRLNGASIIGYNARAAAERQATLSAKESIGVATEAEIVENRLISLRKLEAQGRITDAALISQAEEIIRKEAKQTHEQLQVRASQYPQLRQLALDYANTSKQVDQLAVSSFGNFENAFADFVSGTKTAAAAFRDMANAIIKDIARMAIRQGITGPLLKGLFDAFGAAGGGGAGGIDYELNTTFGHNAAGTDNWRGGPTWVGEQGPELVNLPRGSQVIPNNVASKMGGGIAIGDTVINVAGNMDNAALQQVRAELAYHRRAIGEITRGARSQSHFQSTGVRTA